MELCALCGEKPRDYCRSPLCKPCRRYRHERIREGACRVCGYHPRVNASHCEECRGKANAKKRRMYPALAADNQDAKLEAFRIQSGSVLPVCPCGEDRLPCLTFDHIAQDGAKRRREGDVAGVILYKKILSRGARPDLRVLCYNCNLSAYRNDGLPAVSDGVILGLLSSMG